MLKEFRMYYGYIFEIYFIRGVSVFCWILINFYSRGNVFISRIGDRGFKGNRV